MWDPYVHIWAVNKDEFLANYRTEQHTAEEFDDLIINYSNLANSVQIQETINQVDVTKIKLYALLWIQSCLTNICYYFF